MGSAGFIRIESSLEVLILDSFLYGFGTEAIGKVYFLSLQGTLNKELLLTTVFAEAVPPMTHGPNLSPLFQMDNFPPLVL